MDPVYENPGFKLSTVSSNEKHSQQRGKADDVISMHSNFYF